MLSVVTVRLKVNSTACLDSTRSRNGPFVQYSTYIANWGPCVLHKGPWIQTELQGDVVQALSNCIECNMDQNKNIKVYSILQYMPLLYPISVPYLFYGKTC